MPFILVILFSLIAVGCAAPEKAGSIDDIPPLVNEVVQAPPEVVYVRLSEGLAECYGDSPGLSIYEDKREVHQVIGVVTNDLSLGYNALIKATVAPGTPGTSRVSYSWQNPFWEGRAKQMRDWARGKKPECE